MISPLIALIKDQVEGLKRKGIPTLSIFSGMQFSEVRKTLENAQHGNFKFLYVSPERLKTSLFLEYLPVLKISLIAVDASIGSLAWAGKFGITAAASIGAGVATALTLGLSRGVVQTSRLLLAGIVVGFLLSAVTSLLLLARPETWRTMQVFLLGSTGYLGWSSTGLLAVIFGACLVPALLLSRGLDALTLGDDTAASLGLSLAALRLSLLAVMSVATAAVVGQVGLVGFIGLVAPHLVRESLTVNHRQLLLAAPLCGGALLQAADLISRSVMRPAELPVGAITACLGGAYLVFLLWRRSRDG